VKLILTFPTVVFSFLLAVCVVWWLLSVILTGLDVDGDSGHHGAVSTHHGLGHSGHVGHAHAGGHGHHGHSHGGHHVTGSQRSVGEVLGFTQVPLPLALSLLALGGFVVSAVVQGALSTKAENFHLGAVVAVLLLVAGIVGGLMVVKAVSKPVGKLFEIEEAPTRLSTVGSICRIRTAEANGRVGHAEVITGPTKGILIFFRSTDARFQRGDTALVVDYDEDTNCFSIDDADELVTPD